MGKEVGWKKEGLSMEHAGGHGSDASRFNGITCPWQRWCAVF